MESDQNLSPITQNSVNQIIYRFSDESQKILHEFQSKCNFEEIVVKWLKLAVFDNFQSQFQGKIDVFAIFEKIISQERTYQHEQKQGILDQFSYQLEQIVKHNQNEIETLSVCKNEIEKQAKNEISQRDEKIEDIPQNILRTQNALEVKSLFKTNFENCKNVLEWPMEQDLVHCDIENIQLTKIEWFYDGFGFRSLRFTLSNGKTSPILGQPDLVPYENFEIKSGTHLSKVIFRVDEEQELSQIDLFDMNNTFIK